MRTMKERFERALDAKLNDLHSRHLYHLEQGDTLLSRVLEEEAMNIIESYEAGEDFLVLRVGRRP